MSAESNDHGLCTGPVLAAVQSNLSPDYTAVCVVRLSASVVGEDELDIVEEVG